MMTNDGTFIATMERCGYHPANSWWQICDAARTITNEYVAKQFLVGTVEYVTGQKLAEMAPPIYWSQVTIFFCHLLNGEQSPIWRKIWKDEYKAWVGRVSSDFSGTKKLPLFGEVER